MSFERPLWITAHLDDDGGRVVLIKHTKNGAVKYLHLKREEVRQIVRAYDRSRYRVRRMEESLGTELER